MKYKLNYNEMDSGLNLVLCIWAKVDAEIFKAPSFQVFQG